MDVQAQQQAPIMEIPDYNIYTYPELFNKLNELDEAFLRNNGNTAKENKEHRLIRNELARRGLLW